MLMELFPRFRLRHCSREESGKKARVNNVLQPKRGVNLSRETLVWVRTYRKTSNLLADSRFDREALMMQSSRIWKPEEIISKPDQAHNLALKSNNRDTRDVILAPHE
jgi:hypothetical protein